LDSVVWLTATCGSRREPLINVVTENKPKVLTWLPKEAHRLGPKGERSGMSAANSLIADGESPAKRRNLTCTGTCTKRGKPVGLLVDASTQESEPQGEPMGLRVGDGGKSECLPVMGGIGVEPGGCTVSAAKRVHHSTRKRADFLSRSLVTKSLANHFREGKQMTAGYGLAGAPSSVTKVHIVAPSVYREVTIVLSS
jgi:hypothetical protein